jgi:hypothetical protein
MDRLAAGGIIVLGEFICVLSEKNTACVGSGSFSDLGMRSYEVRSTCMSRHREFDRTGQVLGNPDQN